MSNYNVQETKLVITPKGIESGGWVWLHNGGWSNNLHKFNLNRYVSEETIQKYNLRASELELKGATNQGIFKLTTVSRISSSM